MSRKRGFAVWVAVLIGLCGACHGGWIKDGTLNISWSGEKDPLWSASSNTVMAQATKGKSAYDWGNHADAGYATGTPVYAEGDPVFD